MRFLHAKDLPPRMRATSVFRTIIAFQQTFVTGVHFDADTVVIDVAPTFKAPRCSGCHRKVKKGYDHRVRTWRHLDLCGMLTLLRYGIRRRAPWSLRSRRGRFGSSRVGVMELTVP